MSQCGNLKHIVDLETLLGWRLSKIDFTSITTEDITYSWGDQTELIKWIHHKDSQEQFGGNFYSINGSNKTDLVKKGKYPLIWLTTPTQGVNRDLIEFNDLEIIVCRNTQKEWLNSTRWTKHIPMLQAIADKIIDKLKGGINIKKDDGVLQYSFRTVPNYSVSEDGNKNAEQKALDIWDAVVINVDLLVNKECRSQEYLDFVNK